MNILLKRLLLLFQKQESDIKVSKGGIFYIDPKVMFRRLHESPSEEMLKRVREILEEKDSK